MSFAPVGQDIESFGISNTLISPSESPHRVPQENKTTTCRIHKIWSYSNFSRLPLHHSLPLSARRNIPDEPHSPGPDRVLKPLSKKTYDRIRPALRLATLMLRQSLYFFHTIRNAEVKYSRRGRGQYRFLVRVPRIAFETRDRNQIALHLKTIADSMVFAHNMDVGALNAVALTFAGYRRLELAHRDKCIIDRRVSPRRAAVATGGRTLKAHGEFINPRQSSEPFYHLTFLSSPTMLLISSTSWTELPHSAQQSLLFALAITLMHELAHAVYQERFRFKPRKNETQEPWFDLSNEPTAELGFAWERWFFGGQVTMCDGEFADNQGSVDVEHMLSVKTKLVSTYATDWHQWCKESQPAESEPANWFLSSNHIGNWFQKPCWDLFGEPIRKEERDGQKSGAPALLITLTPYRTKTTWLYDRGEDDDPRGKAYRCLAEDDFEDVLASIAEGTGMRNDAEVAVAQTQLEPDVERERNATLSGSEVVLPGCADWRISKRKRRDGNPRGMKRRKVDTK